jgi:hypothetical protein
MSEVKRESAKEISDRVKKEMAAKKKATLAGTKYATPLSRAADKAAKKGAPKVDKPKAPKVHKETVYSLAAKLLLQRNLTDEEIEKKLGETYSSYKGFDAARKKWIINDKRSLLNKTEKDRIVVLYRVDGKLIARGSAEKQAPKADKSKAILTRVSKSLPTGKK